MLICSKKTTAYTNHLYLCFSMDKSMKKTTNKGATLKANLRYGRLEKNISFSQVNKTVTKKIHSPLEDLQNNAYIPLPLNTESISESSLFRISQLNAPEAPLHCSADEKLDTVSCSLLNLGDIQINEEIDTEVNMSLIESESVLNDSSAIIPQNTPEMTYPEEITVVIAETETVCLFDMPSITVEKGSEEGDAVEKSNETYEYLTVGKGKNRKTISTETQTDECILKTRYTMVPKVEYKNSYAFASAWDMYDSFKDEEIKNLNEHTDEKCSLENLSKNENFKDAALVMERILANNVFNKEQESFKCISEPEETEDLHFKYLWSFVCDDTRGRTVTAMCWNIQNPDILAVGYGKYYIENTDGVVAIWNIKNPIQPERLLRFKIPVTSMAFSTANPNLLAIGFYNGNVKILDIASSKIVAQSSRKTCASYEPIWEVTWHKIEDVEVIIAAGQDGRINQFTCTKTQEFICTQIMKLYKVDGSIKGNHESFAYKVQEVPILQNPMCLLLCLHPTADDIYFVGTMDGCIYKCCTTSSDKYIDVFKAHDGPVYGMQFSSFRTNIFVTCGADWTVKLWIESITVPLIILSNTLDPIKAVLFCPTHSTVIAAISSRNVYLWDLENDSQMLQKELKLEINESAVLMDIKSTSNGKNIVVADAKGGVHIYSLSKLRQPEFDEGLVLDNALDRILIIKPDLMKKVNQIRKSM
ncbi:dynein axonemal intermediate chain 4 [Arctopsyche grandis]|uniref:dynein axonemal intermediate chain 4 n=1 Tax=Arctopsyche grandis TaxID=121162 RepID=UPI00406D9F5E